VSARIRPHHSRRRSESEEMWPANFGSVPEQRIRRHHSSNLSYRWRPSQPQQQLAGSWFAKLVISLRKRSGCQTLVRRSLRRPSYGLLRLLTPRETAEQEQEFPSAEQLEKAGWGRRSFAEEQRREQVAAVLFAEREEKERLEMQLQKLTRTAELAKTAAAEEQAKAERAQEETAAQGLEYSMKLVELQAKAEQAKATAKDAEQLQSQELCKILASTYRYTCRGTAKRRLNWITHATDPNPHQRLIGGGLFEFENPLVPVPLPNDWEQIHTHYHWEATILATALGWCADVLWLQCKCASAATPPSEGLVRDAQRLAEAMSSVDSALSDHVLATKQNLEGFVAQAPVLVAQNNVQHELQTSEGLRWFSSAPAQGSTPLQHQAPHDLEAVATVSIWSSDEEDNQSEQTPAPQAEPVKDNWDGGSPTSSPEEGVPPVPQAKPPETKQCRICTEWKAKGAFSDRQWKTGSRRKGASKGKRACSSCLQVC
jgi:hypothetical protein